METKLRIAFIKDWHDELEHIGGNADGILAAVAELSKRHDLRFFTHNKYGNRDIEFTENGINYVLTEQLDRHWEWIIQADVILSWGSLDRPWHARLPRNVPAILCFAGGPTEHPHLHNFDHIVVESEVYFRSFSRHVVGVSRAFGTNTDIFRPEPRTPKIFDAIYPASFCYHKNQEVFARAMGPRGLAVGNYNVEDIVGKCLQFGTPTVRRVSSAALSDLYNMARVCVVPCGPSGGAQRVVLESFACGIPVVLADDNDKCAEFVTESGFGELAPPIPEAIRDAVERVIAKNLPPALGRDYIMSKWTHHHYAAALERAIEEVLK